MKRILAVVVGLLLIQPIQTNVAVASENLEHTNKYASAKNAKNLLKKNKVDKIIFMMESLGVYHPDIAAFVKKVDSRSKRGYLMLYEKKIGGGALSMRYALEPKISANRVEFRYVPKNSNTEYSVRTNSAMVKYKLKF